jgi:phage gp16-like protein
MQKITTAQRKWIQILHIARKQCGLDEEAYRALLSGAAGVGSSGDITTWKQYNDCLTAFKKLGFKVQSKTSRKSNLKETEPQQGRSEYMISSRQEYYIRGLWDLASRVKNEVSLRGMIKRIGGVDNIQWLTKENAGKVILALRDITRKAGYNPDRPPGKECDQGQT